MSWLVRAGTGLAIAGTAHTVVNAVLLRRPGPAAVELPQVSVLVPARNEATQIVGCLNALRAQACAEILVLDDSSTDATGELARAVGDPRIRVLDGDALRPGWLGKPQACARLAAEADPGSAVLLFLDADVRLAPGAVRAAVGLLAGTGLDLVSPYPRQLAGSPAERLVQPLLQWSWLTALPLRAAERSRRRTLSAANGQFLAVRRDAYEACGGHGAVRDAVLDDLALIRAVKHAGGRGGMVDGSALATCRMYEGWGSLRDGYSKSLWAAFGSEAGAAGALALLGLAYVVPAVAALRGSRAGRYGYLAGVAGRVVSARVTGSRAWPDAAAHPISIGLLGYLTVRSVVGHRRGRLRWKDRVLP